MKILFVLSLGTALSVTPTPIVNDESFEDVQVELRDALLSSPGNPLMDEYKEWAAFGNEEIANMKKQEEQIQPELLPFVGGQEKREDVCPPLGGSLTLREDMQKGEYGRIFLATIRTANILENQLEGVVVKYVTDCHLRMKDEDLSVDRHPLVREWKFLSILNGTTITPNVYYLSPPAVLRSRAFGTSRFMGAYLRDNMDQCMRLGTHLRYMVQEKIPGRSFHKYVKKFVHRHDSSFTKDLLILFQPMLRLLKALHTKGIVHGDMHGGNVMLTELPDYRSRITFIDFEHAEFMAEGFEKPPTGHPADDLNVEYLSPWQLQGFRKGPRDDIYRAVEMLARALSRNRFGAGLRDHLSKNRELVVGQSKAIRRAMDVKVALETKLKEPMFSHSIVLASRAVIGTEVSEDVRAQIINLLDDLANHVRTAYPHPDSPIDYQYIADLVSRMLALL
jgi:tRNA A-37 threonylcarbamoyl transferase component Bud32